MPVSLMVRPPSRFSGVVEVKSGMSLPASSVWSVESHAFHTKPSAGIWPKLRNVGVTDTVRFDAVFDTELRFTESTTRSGCTGWPMVKAVFVGQFVMSQLATPPDEHVIMPGGSGSDLPCVPSPFSKPTVALPPTAPAPLLPYAMRIRPDANSVTWKLSEKTLPLNCGSYGPTFLNSRSNCPGVDVYTTSVRPGTNSKSSHQGAMMLWGNSRPRSVLGMPWPS